MATLACIKHASLFFPAKQIIENHFSSIIVRRTRDLEPNVALMDTQC